MTATCVQIISEPDEPNATIVFSIPKSELNQHTGPFLLNEFRIERAPAPWTPPAPTCAVDLSGCVPVTAVDDGPAPIAVKCPVCNDPGAPDHTCPYKEDINGDTTTLCNCCDFCRQVCATEI